MTQYYDYTSITRVLHVVGGRGDGVIANTWEWGGGNGSAWRAKQEIDMVMPWLLLDNTPSHPTYQ